MAAVAVAVSGVHHVVRETLAGAEADIRNAVRFTGCALICVFARTFFTRIVASLATI